MYVNPAAKPRKTPSMGAHIQSVWLIWIKSGIFISFNQCDRRSLQIVALAEAAGRKYIYTCGLVTLIICGRYDKKNVYTKLLKDLQRVNRPAIYEYKVTNKLHHRKPHRIWW